MSNFFYQQVNFAAKLEARLRERIVPKLRARQALNQVRCMRRANSRVRAEKLVEHRLKNV